MPRSTLIAEHALMRSRSLVPTVLGLALAVGVGSCTSSTEPPRATAVQLIPGAVALDAIGANQTIVATVLDQRSAPMSGAGLTWSTNAAGVATVSPAGVVTAVTNGTATITATVGGKLASVQVTVAQLPLAPVVVAGNSQTGGIQTQLATALQVRIEDRLGNAMAAQPVTFAVSSGGGSITITTVNSDAGGLASTRWTLGSSTATLQRVSAAVAGNSNVTFFTANPLAGPPVSMVVAPGNSADGQFAKFGTAVAINPAVQVVDVLGNGVAEAAVTWSVLSGGGSLTGAASVTNASGVATVGSWTLGAPLGANSMQAAFGGLTPILFTATATPDPCTPAGATPITLGVMRASTISATDCQMPAPGLQNFEFYRLDLVATTSMIMEMNSAQFDTWLFVYDFTTQALIAENDDIQSGILTNSRIAITLPAGSYLLRARTFDPGQTGNYTLLVRTALLGVPAIVAVNTGNGQLAAPGGTTPVAPSVRVTDEADLPVAGITVEFATVPGFGSASGATAVTNASGIATVGSWTLAAGANVLSATVSGANPTGNPVVFSATGKATGAGFDIGLRFVAVPTPSQLQTFSNAAARWESIITGDLPAQPINSTGVPGACGSPSVINETVDDVIIFVRLEVIDGVGQILGSAGPCASRAGPSFIPAAGSMRFDTADLANLESAGNFGNVILHEMGHVLGIGTIWGNKGFLINPSSATSTLDTQFSGPLAITAFNGVGGSTYTQGGKVPVENRPDETNPPRSFAGTRNSHWRETVLLNELMTGFLNGGSNPLSALTIASLQDLGYVVNSGAADAFFVTTSLRAEGDAGEVSIELKDDVLRGPIYLLDRLGRFQGASPALPPSVPTKKPRPLR